jgi:hypothetical protein
MRQICAVVHCFEWLLLVLMGLLASVQSLVVNSDHSVIFFGMPFLADEVICHPSSLHVVAELNLSSVRIARALRGQTNLYYFTMSKRGQI